LFPRVPDQHKEGKPLVPNGLGVLYVLFTTVYLFAIYFLGITNPDNNAISAPLTLAACILFGGFMGLLDDWMDLKWRYKAFMPLIASLPLIYFAYAYHLRTEIMLPFDGVIEFSNAYYFIVIPLIVMIVTNTVNMLGGLNGLESCTPAIVLLSLLGISEYTTGSFTFMIVPILFWLVIAVLNFKGSIFVGNSGSFAIGMTIASFAIVADVKSGLLISILPYVFNSALILLTIFFVRKRAAVAFDGKKLVSDHRRSLVTLITYKRPMTERKVVTIILAIFVVFSVLAFLAQVL